MPVIQKILLVDDDEYIADILNRAAASVFPEALFIYIRSFSEAVEYLSGLKGSGPKLILLDFDLQTEMTGFDFLTVVRSHPQGRLVPVVLLTACPDKRLVQQAYDLGANVCTQKPQSYAEWKAYVEQLRTYWFRTATTPKLYFEEE